MSREYEIVFVTTSDSIDETRLLAERLWRKWYRWHKNETFGPDFPKIEARIVRKSTVTEAEYEPEVQV